jgi:hypothetical protein
MTNSNCVPMNDVQLPEVMNMKQAAGYLRISKAHLSNVLNGKVSGVPPLRHAAVGRRILIKRAWAEQWLEEVGGGVRA